MKKKSTHIYLYSQCHGGNSTLCDSNSYQLQYFELFNLLFCKHLHRVSKSQHQPRQRRCTKQIEISIGFLMANKKKSKKTCRKCTQICVDINFYSLIFLLFEFLLFFMLIPVFIRRRSLQSMNGLHYTMKNILRFSSGIRTRIHYWLPCSWKCTFKNNYNFYLNNSQFKLTKNTSSYLLLTLNKL